MTAMTYGGAVRWARPAVAMLVAQVAAALTTERIIVCDECGASWLGYPDDPCDWCARALDNQRRWQGELVLKVPDVDPDDRQYDGVMLAWRQRLKVAVEAGLVDEMKARNAWERAQHDSTARLGRTG